jgi:hypothetical protein
MKALRLAIVTGLVTATLGLAAPPVYANDCSDTKPGQQCGGCSLNPDFSLEDPRPVRCWV